MTGEQLHKDLLETIRQQEQEIEKLKRKTNKKVVARLDAIQRAGKAIKRRVLCGLLYLTGKTYDQIAEELQISRVTVADWLNWCRTIFPFSIIEDYRHNLRMLTAKPMEQGSKQNLDEIRIELFDGEQNDQLSEGQKQRNSKLAEQMRKKLREQAKTISRLEKLLEKSNNQLPREFEVLKFNSTVFASFRNGDQTKTEINIPELLDDAIKLSGKSLSEICVEGIYRLLEQDLLILPGINGVEKRQEVLDQLKSGDARSFNQGRKS